MRSGMCIARRATWTAAGDVKQSCGHVSHSLKRPNLDPQATRMRLVATARTTTELMVVEGGTAAILAGSGKVQHSSAPVSRVIRA